MFQIINKDILRTNKKPEQGCRIQGKYTIIVCNNNKQLEFRIENQCYLQQQQK